MKGLRRAGLIFVAISLVLGNFYTLGWAQGNGTNDDPVTHEWNILDLIVARPLGIAAGILGTGVFILSLPFTIPTGSTEDAAQMLVVKPFNFSFAREFPDENM